MLLQGQPSALLRLLVALLVPTSLPALAQTPSAAEVPRPRLEARAIEAGKETITLDGVLDEDAWQLAAVASGFVQHDPYDGVPASEDTELRVVYSPTTLYIGIHCHDTDAGQLIAKEMERDAALERDDSLFILLDTFHDRRNGYVFLTNPNAARTDLLINDEGRNLNLEWNGVWSVATRRHADGWVAELAIPFSTLRFDPTLDTWGLNVQRNIRHRNEVTHWAALPRDVGISPSLQQRPVYRVSLAGELYGLSGLRTSRQLDVKPYVTAGAGERRSATGGPRDGFDEQDAGLDVKWGITNALALDVTLNTDFAEVEVDDQQVNLTRFSLFFPEKREFFLENSGIFDFGPPLREDDEPPLLKAFFSRRVGLDAGREVPIDWGARLTGRPGNWNLGVLTARTGAVETSGGSVSAASFGVLRFKRNLGQRSSLGALFTENDPSGSARNRTLGIDFDLKPTRKLSLNGFAARSDDAAGEGDDEHSSGLGLGYDGRQLVASLDLLEVGEGFQPESGFLLRENFRRINPRARFTPRTPRLERFGVRGWFTEAIVDYFERASDGALESRRVELSALGMRTTRDDRWRLSWVDETERIFTPFAIFPGIAIAPGLYRFSGWDLGIRTNDRRVVSLRGTVLWGDFFSGERRTARITLLSRPSRYLRTSTGWVRNDVDLREGAFVTTVVSQRVDVSFTPDLRLNALLQYNDAVDFLGANLRLNWSYRPGADLYLVYNETWDSPSVSARITRDRQVIAKVTYLFRR